MSRHEHESKHEHHEDKELAKILEELRDIFREIRDDNRTAHEDSRSEREILKKILGQLTPPSKPVAKSLIVKFGGIKMNLVLKVGQTTQATAHEFSGLNGSGTELPLAGAVSWVSDDPTVATVDPTSGLVSAIAPSKLDASNAPIPVNITATDAANNLSGSSSVTDTPLSAQSLVVTFGDPQG